MTKPDSGPLPRSEWLEALRELSMWCADDAAHNATACILEMSVLLRLAPQDADLLGVRSVGPMQLHALLGLEAEESAAMAMLGYGTGLLLSRSGDGHSYATLSLPGMAAEQSGSGNTPALALIGALALSLYRAQCLAPLSPESTGRDRRLALH